MLYGINYTKSLVFVIKHGYICSYKNKKAMKINKKVDIVRIKSPEKPEGIEYYVWYWYEHVIEEDINYCGKELIFFIEDENGEDVTYELEENLRNNILVSVFGE